MQVVMTESPGLDLKKDNDMNGPLIKLQPVMEDTLEINAEHELP